MVEEGGSGRRKVQDGKTREVGETKGKRLDLDL